MRYAESDPTKRRIPIYLEDTAGNPVTGVVLAASDIRVTKSGDPMADSLGTAFEVGGGLYYYVATQAEATTLSYIMIAVTGTGAKKYVYNVDIGNRIVSSNPVAGARHIPIYLENAANVGISGLVLAGLSTISKNGTAFAAPTGTFTELENGAYDYRATVGEIDTVGIGVIRVLDASILDFVYTWDVFGASGNIAVTNVTPVPPAPVFPQDPIQFDVTSPADFALIIPMMSLNPFTVPEPTHDFVDFEPLYVAGSSRVAITNGFRYTLRREGGWYAQPNLIIYAVDTTGAVWIGPP